MGIKVSVIIPVYNCEKYIAKTIESLIHQTLQECEFIFVNDGSKDNSQQIIESYAKKDNRISLINQENQGVSEARNTGLKVAQGEYIGFVDGDDYVTEHMYERLYSKARDTNSDLVFCNFTHMQGQLCPFKAESILDITYIQQNIQPYLLVSDSFNSTCNKLFCRQMIKKHQIEFPKGVALGEDGIFNVRFFTHCQRAMYIDYAGYTYRDTEGSATRSIGKKDFFKRDLEVYTKQIGEQLQWSIPPHKVRKLKAIRLLNSVISNTFIYFNAKDELSLYKRYSYINQMIKNNTFQDSLQFSYEEVYPSKGRYEKFILKMIKGKCTFGILLATSYSRMRG